jgi:hypothetical protein
MQLSHKKRLDIFVEQHGLAAIEEMLSVSGFRGWSIFQGIEGAGAHGPWRQTGVGEQSALLIVAIGGADAAHAALDWLEGYFKEYPGIATLSDVAVMRADRF